MIILTQKETKRIIAWLSALFNHTERDELKSLLLEDIKSLTEKLRNE